MRREAFPVVLALFAAGAASAQSEVFRGTDEVGGGGGVLDLELADLNSDGVLDLVTVGSSTSEIAVQLGLAAGGFASETSYPAGSVSSVELIDADQDGNLDVAECTYPSVGGANVRIWLGDGTGALSAAADLAAPGKAREAVAADFDADGFDDLATRSDLGVAWARGLGAASFGAFAELYPTADAFDLDTADTTGDGVPDLAVGSYGAVLVFPGGAPGGLASPSAVPTSSSARAITLDDVSGDGLADIVAGSSPGGVGPAAESGVLELFAADGAGAWSAFASEPLDSRPLGVSVGDFDADGLADVVVAEAFHVAVLRGAPDGVEPFGEWIGGACQGGCYPPQRALFHDVDADGHDDLLVADAYVRSYPWRGTAFAGPRAWGTGDVVAQGDKQPDLAALDLDGDGLSEVVLPGSGGLYLLSQDGAGGVQAAAAMPGGGELVHLHAVQLDGDGVPDLLSIGTSPPAVHAQLGDASLALGAPTSLSLPINPSSDSVAADFDGDGAADLAITTYTEVVVVRTDGAGGFLGPLELPFTDPSPSHVAAGDMNLDGFVDLAAIGTLYTPGVFGPGYYDPRWRVYLGDGTGGFAIGGVVDFDLYLATNDFAVADLDVDGLPDVLALGTSGAGESDEPRLRVYTGDGAGSYSSQEDWTPAADALSSLWVSDLTGDGLPDVLTGGNDLALMVQSPGGALLPPVETYDFGSGGKLVDLDGDGWLDALRLASVSSGTYHEPQVSVLPHVGAGAGALTFGTGTPGCLGEIGLTASGTPVVGASDFALVGSNVPPGSLGLGLVGTVPDFAGSDPFGLGLTMHVGLAGVLMPFAIDAGVGGEARAALPIPANPTLKGKVVYAQSAWLPPAYLGCGSAFGGFTTSRGLRLVVQ